MKKVLFVIIFNFIAQGGFSTSNKTTFYIINSNYVNYTETIDQIELGNNMFANIGFLFDASDSKSYWCIRKYDENNQTFFSRIYPIGAGLFYPKKFVQTVAGNFIVIGSGSCDGPSYILLDNNGDFISGECIEDIDMAGNIVFSQGNNRSDIERVYNLSDEQYIFTSHGARLGEDPNLANNNSNIICIDDVASLVWAKKYFQDPLTVNTPYVKDNPQCIRYTVDANNNGYFQIVGSRSTSNIIGDDKMFIMGIDNSGNIVKNYRDINPYGSLFSYSLVKNNANECVLSYKYQQSTINLPEALGILHIDNEMNFISNSLITINNFDELNASDLNYYFSPTADIYNFVGFGVNSNSGSPNIIHLNFSLPLAINYAKIYNENTIQSLANVNSKSNSEAVSSFRAVNNIIGVEGNRIITAQNNGKACGHNDITYNLFPITFDTTEKRYFIRDYDSVSSFILEPVEHTIETDDCDFFTGGAPNYKNAPRTVVNNLQSSSYIYPSILNTFEDCFYHSNQVGTILLTVYSYDGKLISKTNQLKSEEQIKLDIKGLNLASGMYILKIQNNFNVEKFKLNIQ